jgi:hypothetical protein
MASMQSTPRAGSLIGYMLSLADISQRTFYTRLLRLSRALVIMVKFFLKKRLTLYSTRGYSVWL